jgi:hypothetical protein
MIQWLYRYIFRGFGIVMLLGILTILYLSVSSQIRRSAESAPAAPLVWRR